MIGVSVDNGVISLENDMMDIRHTTFVMRLIHKWFYITIVMKRGSLSLDCEIFLKSLLPEGCFEYINRRDHKWAIIKVCLGYLKGSRLMRLVNSRICPSMWRIDTLLQNWL